MSFWTRQKNARRINKMFVYFGPVQNILVYFGRVENTVRLNKTLQIHQRIRCDMCNVGNSKLKNINRQNRADFFRAFYSYAPLPLNICHFGRGQNERTSNLLLKHLLYFKSSTFQKKGPPVKNIYQ